MELMFIYFIHTPSLQKLTVVRQLKTIWAMTRTKVSNSVFFPGDFEFLTSVFSAIVTDIIF